MEDEIRVGDVLLEKYVVERVLGEGGFAQLFAVRHVELDEVFAIKVMHAPDTGLHGRLVERFMLEARATARIKSEHVVRVFDVDRLKNGLPCIVMEMVEGHDLRTLIENEGKLPVQDAIRYMVQACKGIREAHRLGIVHRDIKPANLIMTQQSDGVKSIKVVDFGIAVLTSASQLRDAYEDVDRAVIGTPHYMAPEQFRTPDSIDERADIWALGVTLFELITGSRPFPGNSLMQVIGCLLRDNAPAPSKFSPEIPSDLDAVVLRCLEKDRAHRFQTVNELQKTLETILGRLGQWSPSAQSAPKEVFLSYADEDAIFRNELVTHLAQLQREGKIRRWDSNLTRPGSEWQAESARKLRTAHVVLLLISPDYLASEYLYKEHLQIAMELRENKGIRVIPILIRPCDWAGTPWNTMRVLPSSGLPVAAWLNRDESWAQIIQNVRQALISEYDDPEEAIPTPRKGGIKAPDEPQYPSDEARVLSQRIEAARYRKKLLESEGQDPSEITREINDLRRRLREDGQLKPGDSLGDGRYLLLQALGRGGFATVFKATDRLLHSTVALKVLHSHLAGDSLRLERFFRGARMMADLGHPRIVRVLEIQGSDAGWNYFCMEFVPGGDLRHGILKRRVPAQNILPILLNVGSALALAHQKQIIHRDIKPANILLEENGTPKLCDFDLVAAADTTGGTRTGALGTFLYAPPEIMEKPQEADARADVFGLGMTGVFAYHGGELPFSLLERKEAFVLALPCSRPVKNVLLKAIQSEPDQRFPDAGAFCEALREAGASSDSKGFWERLWK